MLKYREIEIKELSRESKIELNKYGVSISLEFLGGVGDFEKGVSLTGSATKLTINFPDGRKCIGLIDFGMFQGCEDELKYNEVLPFNLKELDFVIATHTHLDHIGKMLYFSKNDFSGVIWTTKVNKEVLPIMLKDIIKLQPENSLTKAEKLEKEIKNLKLTYLSLIRKFGGNSDIVEEFLGFIEDKELKLEKLKKEEKVEEKEYFDIQDLINTMDKVNGIRFYQKVEIDNNVELSFIKAGHLPGAAQVILKIKAGKDKIIKIGFSGDIGKFYTNSLVGKADISREKLDLFMVESTYAGREHPEEEKQINEFIAIINSTIKKGGKIIIPAFMQLRAQEIAIFLFDLMEKGKIPIIPIFFHSKSIEKINEVYLRNFPKTFQALGKLEKAINGVGKNKYFSFEKTKGSAILIASGGMLDGGTINNYFEYLQEPKNLFVSVGFQAPSTIGYKIFEEKVSQIEVKNQGIFPINAQLYNLRIFSGHGDEKDLLYLIKNMSFSENAKIIINHGEKTKEQLFFEN